MRHRRLKGFNVTGLVLSKRLTQISCMWFVEMAISTKRMAQIWVNFSENAGRSNPVNTKQFNNIYTMLDLSNRRCINVIQMFCV